MRCYQLHGYPEWWVEKYGKGRGGKTSQQGSGAAPARNKGSYGRGATVNAVSHVGLSADAHEFLDDDDSINETEKSGLDLVEENHFHTEQAEACQDTLAEDREDMNEEENKITEVEVLNVTQPEIEEDVVVVTEQADNEPVVDETPVTELGRGLREKKPPTRLQDYILNTVLRNEDRAGGNQFADYDTVQFLDDDDSVNETEKCSVDLVEENHFHTEQAEACQDTLAEDREDMNEEENKITKVEVSNVTQPEIEEDVVVVTEQADNEPVVDETPFMWWVLVKFQSFAVELLVHVRLLGKKVIFITGTDEHGEKIATSAAANGRNPSEHCDLISQSYRTLWKELDIAYDKFVRTTDPKHEAIVKEFYDRVFANGDIYRADYEGLYCVNCEEYKDEKELLENNCCPVHQMPSFLPSKRGETQSSSEAFK
ncbi:hypothetical protein F2Q70_00040916 [Brassica cretica]|uniref:Methionyl/Leucyl tRNA synthetase domain-containing protein n=1 Tax=Brassica cretica TaxID=69181 RepID=A0A8S9KA24_BRACR|nr:hypothetical protein F2Q70_00040916 [Brassica cretica]